MLSDHYSFAIEDLRGHEPRPADVEWRAARADLAERRARERAPSAGTDPGGTRRRWKPLARYADRRRRAQGP